MARIPRRLAGIGASDLSDNAEFDSYVGPAREITVDPVRGIIALHDGVTLGGQQVLINLFKELISYPSRALALLGFVPNNVNHLTVRSDVGLLEYARDVNGTALITADGAKWSPANEVRPEHWGVVGNPIGTPRANFVDETAGIVAAIRFAATRARKFIGANAKIYAFQESYVREADVRAYWRSDGQSIAYSLKTTPATVKDSLSAYEADAFVEFNTTSIRNDASQSSLTAGGTRITLASIANIIPGDTLLSINSTRTIETDNRGEARHGWWVGVKKIIDIANCVVELERPIPTTMKLGNYTGTVTAINTSTRRVTVSGLPDNISVTDAQYRILFNVAGSPTRYAKKFEPILASAGIGVYSFDEESGKDIPAGLEVGSTFEVQREIAVGISRSVKCDIQGWIFERDMHEGAVPAELGYRGLVINRGYKPKIKDVQVKNFSEAGIVTRSCYMPRLKDLHIQGANRAYNGHDGTGYGVSVFQSSWAICQNISGFGCRRILDFSGTQQVSYHCYTDNIEGYGGGTAYDGNRFFPNGPTECSVVGSHGAAFYTRYNRSKGFNVNTIVNLRGMDEIVRDISGGGQMDSLLSSFLGDGVEAEGFFYTDGVPDWVTDARLITGYPIGGKLTTAVIINGSNIISGKPHMLSNFHLRGVKRSLVEIQRGGSVGPIVISGAVDIVTDNDLAEGGTGTNFHLIRAVSGTPTLTGPVKIGDYTIINKPSAPKTLLTEMSLGDFTLAAGAYLKSRNVLKISIPDDGMVKLPVSRNGTARFSLRLNNRGGSSGTNAQITDAQIQLGRAGDGYGGAIPNTLVDIIAAIPDTTTPTAVDGRVTVAYLPTGGENALYVMNRLGTGNQIFVIECDAMM